MARGTKRNARGGSPRGAAGVDPNAPITEKQFFQTWIQANTAELGPALSGTVVCSNPLCAKTYRAADGVDLDRLHISCPHCRPARSDKPHGSEHPHGTPLAWTGQGFTCGSCKRRVPVKYRMFYKNIGLLVARSTDEVGGMHCRRCIDVHFLEGTVVSGLVGWFGVVALVLNPFLLAANVVRYLTTIGMPAAYPTTPATAPIGMPVDTQMQARIEAELPGMFAAIEAGRGYQRACTDAAKQLKVSPIDVRLALQSAERDWAAKYLQLVRR